MVKKVKGSRKPKGRKKPKGNIGNRNYKRGYSLERECVLTLEYNGYHVKRNFRSWGVEDVISASNGKQVLFIQAKNYSDHNDSVLDEYEQWIFVNHSLDYGALPIYLHVPKRGVRCWLDLSSGTELVFNKFTKEWERERSRIKKLLSALKDPKRGGSRKKWKKYVRENYESVKSFIC